MAVSIVKRPVGFIFASSSPVDITAATPQSGEVNLNVTIGHGIATGDFIYVKTPVAEYNGFWYVSATGSQSIFISEFSGAANVRYIKSTTGTIQKVSSISGHGWNCVHLPIVYKLSNTLWPTNSADTVRTMSGVADSNGYCNITASGDIKATGSAAALEYVKITNATDDDLNGVWQILTYSSDTSFVLDIPYSAANDTALTGASIQYYYNNYVVKVQVWGGLNNEHPYYGQKPYELLATLDLIPDEDNICMFSISEILKKHIEIENNLLLGTLPNNLDAWTGFFIKHAEEYDDSDGTTLGRSTVSYTSDLATFEGYSANSLLQFKNVYSGSLSEYVSGDSTQKFLTNWNQPTIFSGKYFDLSYINNGLYDSFDNPALSTFINQGAGTLWTTGATPSISPTDGFQGAYLSRSIRFKAGITYRFAYSVTNASASNFQIVAALGLTSATDIVSGNDSHSGAGTFYGTIELTYSSDTNYLLIAIADNAGGGTGPYTLNAYWVYPVDDADYATPLLQEGDSTTDIDISNEGVFRVALTDPNCDNSSVDVTILKAILHPVDPPGAWTNTSGAFDSKTFTTFVESVTSATGSLESYMPLVAAVGDIVEITFTVVVTGTAVFIPPFGISVAFNLRDGAGGAAGTTSDTLFITANGTYSHTIQILCTVTAARLAVILGEEVSSGTASVTITVPQTVKVIKPDAISETKTIDINCDCVPSQAEEGIYLSWLNNLGGFDYWLFTAYKDHIINITDSGETKVNTFPNWPNSYGEFSDTIRKQTFRDSETQILVRSQHLTKDQITQIQSIKTSPLVQIVNSIYDRRTVLVDTDSFTVYQEEQKLYQIQFTITYTDDVPSQRI